MGETFSAWIIVQQNPLTVVVTSERLNIPTLGSEKQKAGI